MKTISQSYVFVPCHSMEDFPTHYSGAEAGNLLACWTATWHPALIATTEQKPDWQSTSNAELRSDYPLLVIPQVSSHILDDGQLDLTQVEDSIVISQPLSRDELILAAIEPCETARSFYDQVSPELARDFWALGYAYLQIQIMTRQLRYSSNLNETVFAEQLVLAAQHACGGDSAQAEQSLVACFDLLLEEKNAYYPVEPELIDLVLLAPTTLGKSLGRQLSHQHAMNLLVTGEVADLIPEKNATAAESIREFVEAEKVSLVGGLQLELADPLLATESIVRQLQLGGQTIAARFGGAPTIFARRRFGLTPALPGLLEQSGFEGAIHATLDDGSFPRGSSSNIRWTGDDGQSVLAFGDVPLSAEEPGAMLGLGLKIGEQIDSAHVATLVFAHWPDRTCESFDDLVRIASYGPLLGNFVRLQDYFSSIYDPGYGDTFTVDEYRSPYLKQAVESKQPQPISRFIDYWSIHQRIANCRALLAYFCSFASDPSRQPDTSLQPVSVEQEIRDLETQLDQRVEAADSVPPPSLSDPVQSIEQRLTTAIKQRVNQLSDENSVDCRLVINPTMASRRLSLPIESALATTKQTQPLWLQDAGKSHSDCVVEVSGCGHVCLPPSDGKGDPLRGDPSVLHNDSLRNEFFEVHVDERTGGLRSIQMYEGRKNLVGQQLALRIPGKPKTGTSALTTARYSEMVVDKIESQATSRIRGQITSYGRLMDGDDVVAKYQQTVVVTRGLPILDLEIKLEPAIELTDSVNHYFCNRLAWKDETATVFANAQESRHQVTSDWFLGTQFIQIRQAEHSATLLTGGLPYHRRVSRRMLDSVLMVGRESRTSFRLGLGVDLPYPTMAASQWTSPAIVFNSRIDPRKFPSGWLYHFDCKNILATWWRPELDQDSKVVGMQIRFKETEGRRGKLTIRCPRKIATAARTDFAGQLMHELEMDEPAAEQVSVEFVGFEYFQISLTWMP